MPSGLRHFPRHGMSSISARPMWWAFCGPMKMWRRIRRSRLPGGSSHALGCPSSPRGKKAIGELHEQARACHLIKGDRRPPLPRRMSYRFSSHRQTVEHDLVRPDILHVGDETHTTSIVLVAGIVQADGGRSLWAWATTDFVRRGNPRFGATWVNVICLMVSSSVPAPRWGGQSVVRAASGRALSRFGGHGQIIRKVRETNIAGVGRLRRGNPRRGTGLHKPRPLTAGPASGIPGPPHIIGPETAPATVN